MSHSCRSCGVTIPNEHFLCRRCFSDAARRLKAGQKPPATMGLTCEAVGLDAERVGQLIKLAHPDRHDNSAEANEATVWLLRVRDAIKQGRQA